jgi:hypothetical protein
LGRLATLSCFRVLVVACATGSVASVHAAEPPSNGAREEARALADQGADAYARGSFERAHELFVRAYALVPAPTIALFEARTLVRLGRFVEARAAYVRSSSSKLSGDAPESHREAVADASSELTALARRIPRYRIVVEHGAADAPSPSVDGRSLAKGSLGSWHHADPGAHELRFYDDDGELSSVRFALREGETRTLRIDAGSSPNPARTVGFVSLGVGAAGLALGVTAGLIAVDAHGDAEKRCDGGTCAPGSPGADALERFEDYRTLSTVGYAVGAAGAVGGAVLLLGSGGDSKPTVAIGVGPRAVRLETTF